MTPSTVEVKEQKLDEIVEETKQFMNRESILSMSGLLKEEDFYVEGVGWMLLREISGEARAEIVAVQSVGLLADQRKIDRRAYERALILNGVVDPESPKGDRKPMFRMGDMDAVMRLGGSKIAQIVEEIEKLSGLGEFSGAVEGNSASTRSGGGTS